ncbi:BamA/TamA family outer membrane protein [Polluticoccus soli]|uniref:BamA/TamA family outer membrane protein n=1 Tax=Polluticoccus soli TaxID=3034150 RepID=UPI0023E16267|nr:BamA/TamA family outer membrane protein [Flavipsychrobacter sp. JY13-12]
MKGIIFLSVLLFPIFGFAQSDTIQQRIFLVGDAGQLYNNTQPVIDWLKKNVDWNDTQNRVLYLGDNIYDMGLPMEGAPTYAAAKAVIDYQIGLVRGKKAKAYFIPGNHDWMNGKIGGDQAAINQVNYINGLGLPNVQAWPLDGCPGPVLNEVDDKVVIVFGDSQWFLHVHDKPGPGSSCAAKTIDEFTTELNEIVQTHPNQLLIFAVHHPFYTSGPHGGGYTWQDHIFPFRAISSSLYIPLPILGSAYPIARGYFGNLQDIYHPLYRNMINDIEATLKKHPNPVHVSGHEHALQLNIKDSIPYIVSGSGSKLNIIKPGKHNDFLHLNYGCSLLEVYKNGKVLVKFYDVDSKDLSTPLYTKQLKTIVPVTPPPALDTNYQTLPDSVTVAANAQLKGSGVKRALFGKNYREEWTEPITIPVFDITKESGGLRPVRQTAGQSRTLTLEEKKGKQWQLRSIERFPQNVIPSDLRVRIDLNRKDDAMSATYPFAAVIVSDLQHSAKIPSPRRKLVYIPDDPRLNRFRNDFKNTVGILEEREPQGVMKTISTEELILRMQRSNNNTVDQKKVLRARLMDNFVMDFNRNDAQFTWATYDTGRNQVYYPIPQNPSQAFFVNQGVIPYLSQKILAIPEIQGFSDRNWYPTAFNKQAYNFDHFFLNALTQEDWENEIDAFLNTMTDANIDAAVNKQPYAIAQHHADHISSVLRNRRKSFKDEMLKYYRYISHTSTITGSKQREIFTVTKNDDGSIHLLVQELDVKGSLAAKMYDRVFDPAVTNEVQLYGLEGNDSFVVTGGGSPIRVRMIGGPGEDKFLNTGNGGELLAYDVNFENNMIVGNPGIVSKIDADPRTNLYSRQQFKHSYALPGVNLAYNTDNGFILGGEIEFFKHKFRKDPYWTRHLIGAQYAFGTQSYRFKYEFDYTDIWYDKDLIARLDIRAPRYVTNFFGLGNNTEFDKNKPGEIEYYRTQYDIGDLFVGIRKNLQSWLNVDIGPSLQYYQVRENQNEGKYLTDTLTKPATPDLYQPKYFAGVEARMLVNSKNNQVMPTRGATMELNLRQLIGLNADHHTPFRADLDLAFFMSISQAQYFVLATRFGGGYILGNFDFPQALYLSGPANLRGFRRDRFAGRGMVYNNTEIRLRLHQFKTYLFPGSWGIMAFNDIGRVWIDDEASARWHDGFGGGFWVSPVHRFVFTGCVAHSKEENIMPIIGFGFQF